MLNTPYLAIKAQLIATCLTAESVQWFNMQYDGILASKNALLIEFPDPILFPLTAQDLKKGTFIVRIHVIRQVASNTDGTICDSIVAEHDLLCDAVQAGLNRFVPGSLKALQPFAWTPWQKKVGMMITFVDFTTSLSLK